MKYINELASVLKLYRDLNVPLNFTTKISSVGAMQAGRVYLCKSYWQRKSTARNQADLIGTLLHELCHVIDYRQKRYPSMWGPVPEKTLVHDLPAGELRADLFTEELCKKLNVPFVSNYYLKEYKKRGKAGFAVWVLRNYGFLVVREKTADCK